MKEFQALGKLLITGEYLVLHGARALALPLTKIHQSLEIGPSPAEDYGWRAFDENAHLWLEMKWDKNFKLISTSAESKSARLLEILKYISVSKPSLMETPLSFETKMNFSPKWGLGSSSTLISLLSQWAGIDPYELQKKFFGGSGYDIACATVLTPLIYELKNQHPQVTPVRWAPSFQHQIYFLYLGSKQDSREAMAGFKKHTAHPTHEDIQGMNLLTQQFLMATSLKEFQLLMDRHERIISRLINLPPVKQNLFSDFPGEIKSLGGWGGDFVMVASEENPKTYFEQKGYPLLLNWTDLTK